MTTRTLIETSIEAKAEMARRELARRRLADFCAYQYPWWKPVRHIQMVVKKLEQVELYIRTKGRKGIGRLIVEMPPRHGKTLTCSQLFPAWLLGRMPDSRIILTSYAADLAGENSRKLREIINSQRFGAVFGGKSALSAPVELSYDSRAKQSWDLAEPHRGGCASAGVGGGITGKGAHLLVVDDPFKNREEADSEARREYVLKWYSSSAETRLEDGGAVIVFHTRWHQDDLTGQLLKAMMSHDLAEQWEVIHLPALAYKKSQYARNKAEQREALLDGIWLDIKDPLGRKPGQALWPEKYDRQRLLEVKAQNEARGTMEDWYSLYQQWPRPMEGSFFGPEDFEIIDASKVPGGLQWYRLCDPAISQKRTADFNASVAEALDEEGNLYLRDMIKVRGWAEFKQQFVSAALSDLEVGTIWGIETVAFQSLAFQELIQDKRLVNVPIIAVPTEKDKVARARPLQTRAKAGKVFLVKGAWNRDFINEALSFPKGRHDDQIDSASGGLRMIADGQQRYVSMCVVAA